MGMGDIASLGRKLERAMRNQTGFNVTLEEMLALIEEGIAADINAAKMRVLQERCRAKLPPSSSAISGSTSDVTAKPPKSGRSPGTRPTLDRSSISALSAGL